MNLTEFYQYHVENKNNFIIGSIKRTEKIDYGVLKKNESNKFIMFKEKPPYEFLVRMGSIYG